LELFVSQKNVFFLKQCLVATDAIGMGLNLYVDSTSQMTDDFLWIQTNNIKYNKFVVVGVEIFEE
jgi:hypothetical protein